MVYSTELIVESIGGTHMLTFRKCVAMPIFRGTSFVFVNGRVIDADGNVIQTKTTGDMWLEAMSRNPKIRDVLRLWTLAIGDPRSLFYIL